MDGLSKMIPDLEYREFMLKLSWQITEQDMDEIKYMLKSSIPEGKKESLNTALKLINYLEQMLFVEPNSLGNLEELFRRMDKPKLCEMVTKFNRDKEQAVECLTGFSSEDEDGHVRC